MLPNYNYTDQGLELNFLRVRETTWIPASPTSNAAHGRQNYSVLSKTASPWCGLPAQSLSVSVGMHDLISRVLLKRGSKCASDTTLHPLKHLVLTLFISVIQRHVCSYLTMVSICFSFVSLDGKPLFILLFTMCTSSAVKYLFMFLPICLPAS